MQIHTMETSISNELLGDEELLWSGSPNPQGKSIVSPARVLLILGLVYLPLGLLLVILGLILWLAVSAASASGGFLGALIPGGIFFVLGLVFLLAGVYGRFTKKNTFYAITNRRVIILRGGRYLHAISYNRRAITQVQRLERPDGSGDLIFAGSSSPYNAYYSNNTTNYSTYNASSRPGVFTAIPNVRQVEQKLLRMLDEA